MHNSHTESLRKLDMNIIHKRSLCEEVKYYTFIFLTISSTCKQKNILNKLMILAWNKKIYAILKLLIKKIYKTRKTFHSFSTFASETHVADDRKYVSWYFWQIIILFIFPGVYFFFIFLVLLVNWSEGLMSENMKHE